ncbi:DUF6165 family protein [Abyssibius alkaniclasticus]|uniref:DUF6165 family protein n=1 Tax=Abyssibius alkaniclasticus TaxID=2881234 RepID=UPI0023632F56|nr:DUF6165 family protein [Abyssibius alkaniclasticus]UPH70629.1 DUF6165 family protein [Abyssibius alkaniclasticus]|tara:strand:- start:138 stop:527 length:390 start_codon:yes stop_codon:yes gene_type:complete
MPDLPRIEISWGEVHDRLSILELKAAKCKNISDSRVISAEIEGLKQALAPIAQIDLGTLPDQLRRVNATLWDVEDALRADEAAGNFDAGFVARARSVYKVNDQRAALKRAINDATGAALYEVKIYSTGA